MANSEQTQQPWWVNFPDSCWLFFSPNVFSSLDHFCPDCHPWQTRPGLPVVSKACCRAHTIPYIHVSSGLDENLSRSPLTPIISIASQTTPTPAARSVSPRQGHTRSAPSVGPQAFHPLAGPKKTRKLWKRFRSSFTSMKNLVAAEDHNTQITTDASYPRGVKRLCIGPDGAGDDTDSAIEQRGRSFLETKWESEVMRKRRKCFVYMSCRYLLGNTRR